MGAMNANVATENEMARPMTWCANHANQAYHSLLPAWLADPVVPPKKNGPAPAEIPTLTSPGTSQHTLSYVVNEVESPPSSTPLSANDVPWADEQPYATTSGWSDALDDWPAPPCAVCGSLELWQTMLGEWRCHHCNPPTASRRFLRHAERIKASHARRGT